MISIWSASVEYKNVGKKADPIPSITESHHGPSQCCIGCANEHVNFDILNQDCHSKSIMWPSS